MRNLILSMCLLFIVGCDNIATNAEAKAWRHEIVTKGFLGITYSVTSYTEENGNIVFSLQDGKTYRIPKVEIAKIVDI
jgi:hypothetical protein